MYRKTEKRVYSEYELREQEAYIEDMIALCICDVFSKRKSMEPEHFAILLQIYEDFAIFPSDIILAFRSFTRLIVYGNLPHSINLSLNIIENYDGSSRASVITNASKSIRVTQRPVSRYLKGVFDIALEGYIPNILKDPFFTVYTLAEIITYLKNGVITDQQVKNAISAYCKKADYKEMNKAHFILTELYPKNPEFQKIKDQILAECEMFAQIAVEYTASIDMGSFVPIDPQQIVDSGLYTSPSTIGALEQATTAATSFIKMMYNNAWWGYEK